MPQRNPSKAKLSRHVGIHVSIGDGIDESVDRAIELGCEGAFQIFTCSPRRWNAAPIEEEKASAFRAKCSKNGFVPFAHMPYMPNLSSPDPKFYSQSKEVLVREVKRCDFLGIKYLVLHTGSSLGTGIEEGKKRLVNACREAISKTDSLSVRLLIENSAGGKRDLGSKFETLRECLKDIAEPKRTGICFDTCHAFASGYEISSEEGVRNTVHEFDRIVGLNNLFLIHANDSKAERGKGIDRHEHIGIGKIGKRGMECFFSLPILSKVPAILETPRDGKRSDLENVLILKRFSQIN